MEERGCSLGGRGEVPSPGGPGLSLGGRGGAVPSPTVTEGGGVGVTVAPLPSMLCWRLAELLFLLAVSSPAHGLVVPGILGAGAHGQTGGPVHPHTRRRKQDMRKADKQTNGFLWCGEASLPAALVILEKNGMDI